MDKIQASTELKEKTAEYVSAALKSGRYEFEDIKPKHTKGIFAVKKFAFVAASFLICAAMATGAYAYYNTPIKYISIDINPSVELGVNAFDTVVTTTSYNEDGAAVLDGVNVDNMKVEDAVSTIVQEAADQGFVAGDGSTVISVTSESNNDNTAEDLQETAEEGVQTALKAKNIMAVVYANCSSLDLRNQAKELGISPGKYKMINILTTLDSTISAADYKSAKMTEIFLKADELMKANPDVAAEKLDLKGVKNAAEKAKAAKGEAEENTNGDATQVEAAQVQTQNQSKVDKAPEKEAERNNNGNGNGQGSKKGDDTEAPAPSSTTEPTATTEPVTTTQPTATAEPAPTAKASASEKSSSGTGNSDNEQKGNGNGNSANSSSSSGSSSKGNGKS